jgi:aerobic C4-dicarboxylate transport protein
MTRFTSHLYFWVLLAIIAGGLLGYADPDTAVRLKPLGDGFIALVKMLISPIIFCTVVLGIAGAGDMKKVGRVGGKALIYFEVVSTCALAIGLSWRRGPSSRVHAVPTLDAVRGRLCQGAASQSTADFV